MWERFILPVIQLALFAIGCVVLVKGLEVLLTGSASL